MTDTSIPSTPRNRSALAEIKKTPKSVSKKTILTFGNNDSYVEEEDATYMYDESFSVSISEDEPLEVESIEEHDSIIEISEPLSESSIELETSPTQLDRDGKFRKFLLKHEIPRKLLHSSIGVFTLWLYTLGINHRQIIAPLTALFTILFINDYIRLHNPDVNQKVLKTWWFLIREKEANTYNGTLFYLAGLIFIFSIVPKDIAVMSVLLLSWADTAASTFGRQFGKYTPKLLSGKSLAGCIASFLVGVFSTYLLYAYFVPNFDVNKEGDIFWNPENNRLSLHVYALFAGLIASVSELVDFWGLDDNFTIPVISGTFLYLLVSFFRYQ